MAGFYHQTTDYEFRLFCKFHIWTFTIPDSFSQESHMIANFRWFALEWLPTGQRAKARMLRNGALCSTVVARSSFRTAHSAWSQKWRCNHGTRSQAISWRGLVDVSLKSSSLILRGLHSAISWCIVRQISRSSKTTKLGNPKYSYPRYKSVLNLKLFRTVHS